MKSKRQRVEQSSYLPVDFVIESLSADAFWMVPKTLGRELGIENAVFLSELIAKFRYWRDRGMLQGDGSFFLTCSDIQEVMGCSERMAKRLTKSIQDCGAARVIKRGVPAKNYWFLNWEYIGSIMSGGPTSQAEIDLTGQVGTDPTSEAKTDPTITKKSDKEPNTKKDNAPEAPALYSQVVKLIGSAHEALTGEPLSWIGYEKAYGSAIKQIIMQAEGAKGPHDNDDAVLLRIRAKVEAYYKLARSEAGQAKKFYTQQGITPLSIRSAWNKLVVAQVKSAMAAREEKFPDVMTMTESQILETFEDWQSRFTIGQVREGLPKGIWVKWQREKNGFAGALCETILAYVNEDYDWRVLVGKKEEPLNGGTGGQK